MNRHGMHGQQIADTMRLAMLCGTDPPKTPRSEYFERIAIPNVSLSAGVAAQGTLSSSGGRPRGPRRNS